MDYWDLARPTYIENWPKELCNLSIAQVDIPLTRLETIALGRSISEWYTEFPSDITGQERYETVQDIRTKVCEAVSKFPAGAFVRLGSRSPKDSWSGNREGFKIFSDRDPLRYLLDCSERVAEDLLFALRHGYDPHIFVRQWVDIPKWSEFRCFMQYRELVGISRYHYFDPVPVELTNKDFIETVKWVIEVFFEDYLLKAIHLDDVVFDVFVRCRCAPGQGAREWEVKLIEINPFFEMTDPCLYDWRKGGDFDKSLRV